MKPPGLMPHVVRNIMWTKGLSPSGVDGVDAGVVPGGLVHTDWQDAMIRRTSARGSPSSAVSSKGVLLLWMCRALRITLH